MSDATEATEATDQARLDDDASTQVVLRALAEEAGITTVWQDYRGVVHTVASPTLRVLLTALGLPVER